LQRSPNHKDQIGFFHDLSGPAEGRHLFAKPYYVGPELMAIRPQITKRQLGAIEHDNALGVDRRLCFPDFPVQMEHAKASRTLVKIVHILGHNMHVKHVLQPGQNLMTFIWSGGKDLPTSLVVKLQHHGRIGHKAFW
jgi:hypothetical protein